MSHNYLEGHIYGTVIGGWSCNSISLDSRPLKIIMFSSGLESRLYRLLHFDLHLGRYIMSLLLEVKQLPKIVGVTGLI